MKKIILAMTMTVFLSSCSMIQSIDATKAIMYAIDSSVLVSSLVKMNDTVTVARASVNENKEKFNSDEWAQLEIAGDQIDEIKFRFGEIFGKDKGIKTRLLSSMQLKYVVSDVFTVYDDVEAIVLMHAEQFTPTQRLQVLTAKTVMDDLRESYDSIKQRAANNESGNPIDATETIQRAVLAIQKIAAVFFTK